MLPKTSESSPGIMKTAKTEKIVTAFFDMPQAANSAYADLTAAGFNSGIVSAFSGLPVIDLDGVVNPEAARAVREKKLLGYLRRRGVDVIVDHLEKTPTEN